VKGRTGSGFSKLPLTLEKDAGRARQVLGRSLRTEEWGYVEWDGGNFGIELYNRKDDPRELNNLADAAELADVRKKLRALLRQLDPTVANKSK
jgi:arylsulfatase A-like enzyme